MGAKVILRRPESGSNYSSWFWKELERDCQERLNENGKTKSSIRRGGGRQGGREGRGSWCEVHVSSSTSFHSTPGFSVFRERRVGWGGVGWRTAGSGPAGAVGDPGMLGFRVRAG